MGRDSVPATVLKSSSNEVVVQIRCQILHDAKLHEFTPGAPNNAAQRESPTLRHRYVDRWMAKRLTA